VSHFRHDQRHRRQMAGLCGDLYWAAALSEYNFSEREAQILPLLRRWVSFFRSTWHIGTMTAFEQTATQLKGLRCSVPPYYVGLVLPDGVPVVAYSGKAYEMLERGFAPPAEEIRLLLIGLRRTPAQQCGATIDLAAGLAGARAEETQKWLGFDFLGKR
jgi:hypothetical protein